jgi:2-polyprenyl-6-methoxyphenol hydroxylase-like FAD-dependent oxidoreductase
MMQAGSRILISGAGVAGLTAAIWLGRNGFRPTLVERSPSVRADGYIVSLSHVSYQYARELGLLDKLRSFETRILTSSYHDRRGRVMVGLARDSLMSGVDVVQLMRDDLQQVLYEAAESVADFRFSTVITKIEQGERVDVEFGDGRSEEFDVVIGADGLQRERRRTRLCLYLEVDSNESPTTGAKAGHLARVLRRCVRAGTQGDCHGREGGCATP